MIRQLAAATALALAPTVADCTGSGPPGVSGCSTGTYNTGDLYSYCTTGNGSHRVRYRCDQVAYAGPWAPVGDLSWGWCQHPQELWSETLTV